MDARAGFVPPLALEVRKRHAFFLRHEQGSHSFEAVGGHPTLPRKFTQRLFDPRGEQASSFGKVSEKQRTAFGQSLEHLIRVRLVIGNSGSSRQKEPIRKVLTREERHRTGPHRHGGPAIPARWRGEPAPADSTCDTNLVKPFGSIVFHAQCKHLRFPCPRRKLVAVEQLQYHLEAVWPFCS